MSYAYTPIVKVFKPMIPDGPARIMDRLGAIDARRPLTAAECKMWRKGRDVEWFQAEAKNGKVTLIKRVEAQSW